VVVLVPDEFAFHLDDADVVVVDLGDDLRLPVFIEEIELPVEVGCVGHFAFVPKGVRPALRDQLRECVEIGTDWSRCRRLLVCSRH